MTNTDSRITKPSSRPERSGERGRTAGIADLTQRRKEADSKSNLSETELIAMRKKLKKLEQEMLQFPEINTSKIVGLHQRIESGDYKIDSDSIAEKLTRLEAELNGR